MEVAQDHDRRVGDERVRQGLLHTRTARDDEFADPLKAINGWGWLDGGLDGKHVLCLAGGGGLQAPLYAAAGAKVTVVDISQKMLERDRQVADERGLELQTLATSMDDLPMLADASFDLATQPVSTHYVLTLSKVFNEIARVLRAGWQYLSQHIQPAKLQSALMPLPHFYAVTGEYDAHGPVPPPHGHFSHPEQRPP